MKIMANTYKFIGKVLPDGHLSLPAEVAKGGVKEFEVTMKPVNHVKETIALYLESSIEKKGRLMDISLDSDAIEKAVKKAFGASNIDDIMESIRK
jgi:ribosome maturation protein Sdo1